MVLSSIEYHKVCLTNNNSGIIENMKTTLKKQVKKSLKNEPQH